MNGAKRIAHNDIVELLFVPRNQVTADVITHKTCYLDERAEIMVRLVMAWMSNLPTAEAVMDTREQPHKAREKLTVEFMVERAAYTVEQIFDTAKQRGWLITTSSAADVVAGMPNIVEDKPMCPLCEMTYGQPHREGCLFRYSTRG